MKYIKYNLTTVDWLRDLKELKLMVEVFTREMFIDLCIFTTFVISIINPLISDDGDFVCYHVISEMLHGDKAAFLYV